MQNYQSPYISLYHYNTYTKVQKNTNKNRYVMRKMSTFTHYFKNKDV